MPWKQINIFFFCVGTILFSIGSLKAQSELVRIIVRPDFEQWEWQPYADSLSLRFARAIENRVREGVPRREFRTDSTSATLLFRFRIDNEGNLKRFSQLTPSYRYISYLIQRTAREIIPFKPLPQDFPRFYFDGNMIFHCRFAPTGRYKRLYFEEPLDSLQEISFIPSFRNKSSVPLFLYESEKVDKKELFESYKKRIGLAEEIKDTTSYAPLDFKGRQVTVHIAYDSLSSGKTGMEALKLQIEKALDSAGAKIVFAKYEPESIKPAQDQKAMADSSADINKLPDKTAVDSLSVGNKPEPEGQKGEIKTAVEKEVPSTVGSIDSSSIKKFEKSGKEPEKGAASGADSVSSDSTSTRKAKDKLGELLKGNLNEAFSGLHRNYLVFSAGIGAVVFQDSALCRLTLFPADKPRDIKRRLDYKFKLTPSGFLPENLGESLVKRLTNPPAKPAPLPPKPAAPQPAVAAKADSTKPVAGAQAVKIDSAASARDSTAEKISIPAAKKDSLAQVPAPVKADSLYATKDSTAAAIKDSTAGALKSPAPVKADTARITPPIDSTRAKPDSSLPKPVSPSSTPQAPSSPPPAASPGDSAGAPSKTKP